MNVLLRLKYILNSYADEQLANLDLYVDNENNIEIVAVDNNAITLITDSGNVEINGKEW